MQIIQKFRQLRTLKHFDSLPSGCVSVDIVFICADANRGMKKNGKFYAQILDPLVDYCKNNHISHLSISLPFSAMAPLSTYAQSHTINWAYLFLRHRTWPWLLSRKIRTKLVVGINIPQFLNNYALNNGIKTIELFHGFGVGESDYIWGRYARRSIDAKLEASVYVTYDKQSYETVRQSLAEKDVAVKFARHHFYDREEYSQLNTIIYVEEKIKKVYSNHSNLTILVSLQHGYDGSRSILDGILDNGLLPECLIEFIRASTEVNWILKPHPVQIRSNQWPINQCNLLKEFEHCKNVSIIDFIEDDVFALLHFVDGHITMSSGTVVEAAMLGVPSLGLCPTLKQGGIMQDAFQNEEAQDLFFRGEMTINCIDEFINNLIKDKDRNSARKNRRHKEKLPSAISYIADLL